jgi:hypothetical protein
MTPMGRGGGDEMTAFASVELYWLPLGAGGHSVRFNGKVFEAVVAQLEKRTTKDLYHSALMVTVPEARFVIEQAPAGKNGDERGVVADGPSALAGREECGSFATRSAAGETASFLTSRKLSTVQRN